MGSKRKNETEEERKERKRSKKEAKKSKKRESGDHEEVVNPASLPVVSSASHNNIRVDDFDPPSPLFVKQKLQMTISLLPGNLGSVQEGVEGVLRGFLLKYSDGFRGILLGFENLRVLHNGKGKILEELPYIHYDIECLVLIFRPVVGQDLEGSVSESFHSHLSIIVFEYFNTSITANQLKKAGFWFDETREKWIGQEGNQALEKGTTMRFKIEQVHESGGIISMDGSNPRVTKVG